MKQISKQKVQITKQQAFDAIKEMFELSDFDKRENGKSFYSKKENGNVTFMFDKRQYTRDDVIGKLVEYFEDKIIVGGQVRVESMTFVWTTVLIEDRAE